MIAAKTILAAMLALPGPWEDPGRREPVEARETRLETIAQAIAVEVPAPWLAWGGRFRDLRRVSPLVARSAYG